MCRCLCEHKFSFLRDEYLKVHLLSPRVVICLIFKETIKLFQSRCTIFPPARCGDPFLRILTLIWYHHYFCFFFFLAILLDIYWCVIICYYGFNSHFPNSFWGWIFSWADMSSVYPLGWNVFSCSLPTLFLLRYNWHIPLYWFQVYNIIYLCTYCVNIYLYLYTVSLISNTLQS